MRAFGIRLALPSPVRDVDLCGDDGKACTGPDGAGEVWTRVKEAAEGAYDKTARCSFTSFIGYEYTAATGASTLHQRLHDPF